MLFMTCVRAAALRAGLSSTCHWPLLHLTLPAAAAHHNCRSSSSSKLVVAVAMPAHKQQQQQQLQMLQSALQIQPQAVERRALATARLCSLQTAAVFYVA
jgi:hypothetical protein